MIQLIILRQFLFIFINREYSLELNLCELLLKDLVDLVLCKFFVEFYCSRRLLLFLRELFLLSFDFWQNYENKRERDRHLCEFFKNSLLFEYSDILLRSFENLKVIDLCFESLQKFN